MNPLRVVNIPSETFEQFKNRERFLFISPQPPFIPWEKGTSCIFRSSSQPEEIEVLVQNTFKKKIYSLTNTDASSSGYKSLHELHCKLYKMGLSSDKEVILSYITLFAGR